MGNFQFRSMQILSKFKVILGLIKLKNEEKNAEEKLSFPELKV